MRETRVLQIAHEMPGEAGADPEDPLAGNRTAFLSLLEEAERFDPDFVNFYELTLVRNMDRSDRPLADLAIEFPGPFIDRVGERAAALDSYVWVPSYERDGDDIYNSMALVGPDGDYLGAYRKVAPTIGEMESRGVTPGSDLPVWDTEFGRVCGTICWDVRFDELALGYRAEEVDLMFHPTHGLGHGKFAHWATYHGFHVAYCWTTDARVFTPHGNVVGRMTNHPTMPTVDVLGGESRFAPVTINTDMKPYGMGEFDYGDSALNDLQREYPEAIAIHNVYEDGFVVVESTDEEVPLSQVEAEFDLPTPERAEYRTRELAGAATGESPLLDPDTF
jgi:hypothetical protein